MLSQAALPYRTMLGGYASHIGIPAGRAKGATSAERGMWMANT